MKYFEELEQSKWEINKPQPALVNLEKTGAIRGDVLDIGCCSGENALYLASQGYSVTGIDSSPTFIARALLKASKRNLKVKFLLFDSLKIEHLGMTFDTVIDCGLFHSFPVETRPQYIYSLHQVLRPGGIYHVLCSSEEDLGGSGPIGGTKGELHNYFQKGWEVANISRIKLETREEGNWHWGLLASILRLT
jgi:cyclopropane fatty-acyl-phospholipid synthase-like methyltransferase